MGVTAIWACAMMLGVDVGWQPHPDGGIEYIIQIEPRLLEVLRAGEEIRSTVPPDLGTVRAYRIRVGEEPLPRERPGVAAGEIPPGQGDERTPEGEARGPAWGELFPPPGPPAEPEDAGPPATMGTSRLPSGRPTGPAADAQGESQLEQSPPKPLPGQAEAAVYLEQEPEGGPSAQEPPPEGNNQAAGPTSRPWLPLTLALAGLFATSGGMLYFGWLAWDYRLRYRRLLDQTITRGGPLDTDTDLPDLAGAGEGELPGGGEGDETGVDP